MQRPAREPSKLTDEQRVRRLASHAAHTGNAFAVRGVAACSDLIDGREWRQHPDWPFEVAGRYCCEFRDLDDAEWFFETYLLM
jgi:hypothetical protein